MEGLKYKTNSVRVCGIVWFLDIGLRLGRIESVSEWAGFWGLADILEK